jgi:hypothetical protein
MKIARVIITWDCLRSCALCVNKNLPVEPKPCKIKDLQGYDQILLTGGEPMLYPKETLDIIMKLRKQTPEEVQNIYLYTAMFTSELRWLVWELNGIHYTVHPPVKPEDLVGFRAFQQLIGEPEFKDKTFRLHIESQIDSPIEIIPSLWARLEVKPMLRNCPLPEGEELFELIMEG